MKIVTKIYKILAKKTRKGIMHFLMMNMYFEMSWKVCNTCRYLSYDTITWSKQTINTIFQGWVPTDVHWPLVVVVTQIPIIKYSLAFSQDEWNYISSQSVVLILNQVPKYLINILRVSTHQSNLSWNDW